MTPESQEPPEGKVADRIVPDPRPCPRCGVRPCRPGQRLCGPCHLEYKRARRAAAPPAKETREVGQETPQERPKETGGPRVVGAPSAVTRKSRRPGPQLPDDWPSLFLEYYARQGVRWRAAKYAGVSHDTVRRAEHADPAFAHEVEDARQTYLDRHALNLNRLAFKKNNVVASIVALKAGRPELYAERNLTINASITTELTPSDGRQLLQAMLGVPSADALPALEAAGPDAARVVLDGELSGPPAPDASGVGKGTE